MPATQCAVWDLNPRLAAYEAAALTTELTALVAAAAAYSLNKKPFSIKNLIQSQPVTSSRSMNL